MLFPDFRQAGGGNGLADAAGFLVRQHQGDFFRQSGVIRGQNLPGGGKDPIAALAGHNPAHENQLFNIVEPGVGENSLSHRFL